MITYTCKTIMTTFCYDNYMNVHENWDTKPWKCMKFVQHIKLTTTFLNIILKY